MSQKDKVEKSVEEQLGSSEIDLQIFDEKSVPGLVVFRAYVAPEKRGRPGRYSTGVATADAVIHDGDKARAAIMAAFKDAGLAADAVAKALGPLEGESRHAAGAIATQADLDKMGSKWQPMIELPKKLEDNGALGIEFFVTGGGDVFLWKTRVMIGTDGAVQRKVDIIR